MSRKRKRQREVQLLKRAFKRTAERQRQVDELRRSNASVPHVSKRRKGTRRARQQRAIDDQS